VKLRLIAATNRNLAEEVERGTFRGELARRGAAALSRQPERGGAAAEAQRVTLLDKMKKLGLR